MGASYAQLKSALTSNFGQGQMEQFTKLYHLRCGSRSLDSYVKEFHQLSNQAAITHMRDDMQVTLFISGLTPMSLRNACQTNGPKTL